MNFYKKAMMAEGGQMPPRREESPEGDGVKQIQMLKMAYDKAIKQKDMEMIGKIETVVKELYDNMDGRAQEAISQMFPQMDFMAEAEGMREMREEDPREREAMEMAEGGKLKMVENEEGKMVPFYAADGKGQMAYGGKINEMMEGGYMKKPSMPGGGYVYMK